MTSFLAALAVIGIGWPISAWLLMLAIGVMHDRWLPVVPAIGYTPALLLTVLLSARTLVHAFTVQALRDALDDDGKP